MSHRGIPWLSEHGSRGRLKAWLIAFNFDRFRALSGPVVFVTQNLLLGASRLIMDPWWLYTIWIALECHQTTHLLFCRTTTEWPRNVRKSCSYVRAKSWESLIYVPSHVHSTHPTTFGSRVQCTSKSVTYIMHLGYFAPSELPKNATKRPIYFFVVHPRGDPDTVVEVIFLLVQSHGSP